MKQESINTENKKYNMNEDEVTEERGRRKALSNCNNCEQEQAACTQ